jgi:hypothetical protein
MALPEFTEAGNLPEGIHVATLQEVLRRFGNGSLQRRRVADDSRRDPTRHRGDNLMIANDIELDVTQERIRRFQTILRQLRVGASPAEYPLVSSGYISEIDKMQTDVMDYLKRHSTESAEPVSIAR